MQRLCTTLALSAVVIAATASPATAQGFGVFEHGTCAMARAGAGSAAPCHDGSAIFFNPAGLTGMRGWTMSVGATGVSALGSFIDDLSGAETDMNNDPIPVPHLYAAYGISDRLTAGIAGKSALRRPTTGLVAIAVGAASRVAQLRAVQTNKSTSARRTYGVANCVAIMVHAEETRGVR